MRSYMELPAYNSAPLRTMVPAFVWKTRMEIYNLKTYGGISKATPIYTDKDAANGMTATCRTEGALRGFMAHIPTQGSYYSKRCRALYVLSVMSLSRYTPINKTLSQPELSNQEA